jgi:acetylornithine/N-succinyldiaminopimelate aminotransferase
VSVSAGTPSDALRQRWSAALMDNYGTPPIALVRGSGARVWDADGTEYVDLVAGIAVNALGHAHPELVAAVADQLATLGHTSNLAVTEPAVALAERLLTLLDPDAERDGRVFFCNSGAEANEAAFKLSRLTGRTGVVAASGGFHGRTMGSLALTGQPAKQDPFRPLPGDVELVPYGDVGALRAAVTRSTAAVFLEPIQGEGGVVTPPPGYLAAAREACDEAGTLLVLDEVQTGVGRTGSWFAFQRAGIRPDVVTLAKGLAGGLPIGACVAFGPAAHLFGPGSHGSTFGGNPVSCAAANTVLDVLDRDGLVERAATLGDQVAGRILAWGDPLVAEVRGAGLLLGVRLTRPLAREVEVSARSHGVLVNAVAPDVVRLAPPLVITDADVDRALEGLRRAVDAAAEGES